MMKAVATIGLAWAALLATPALARVEQHKVHSIAVEGNLEGNSADRAVHVILPPSYDTAKKRRYPVVYFLHGYNSTADSYMGRIPFDEDVKGTSAEMIVVVPDSMTKWGGSMYSNSPTIGNFEDFIAVDLVRWVDAHFRTLARKESRGLVGHSMGGYGTLKLGMKHPDVFGALYAMNPCCMIPRPASLADAKFETMTVEQALAAPWMERGNFAVAAAWSPNPGKPPFYADQGTSEGKPNEFVLAQWAANSPAAMAAGYVGALKSMAGIAIDTGDTDFVKPDDVLIHDTLTKLGVAHEWEIYVGDHGNRVTERFKANVLPFFARHLKVKP
jgi:S-formylglutathione hydrolase FrmB